MNEPIRDVDEAIERVLAWRSTRAAPVDLLRDVRAALEPIEQRRAWPWSTLSPMLRLALLGAVVGLLGILAIGAAVVGSRPDLATEPPRPSSAPGFADATPSVALLFDCVDRPLSASAPVDLTGSWWDRANLYYLRQVGKAIWGVAINSPAATYPDLVQVGPYLVFHGSLGTGGVLHLDWASAGDRHPGDARFGQYNDKSGSMTLTLSTAGGGNVRLVTTAETGDAISGNAYSLPTLVPCSPVVR